MPVNANQSYWFADDWSMIPGLNSMTKFTDKERVFNMLMRQVLNICQSMVRYEGLPETIPERMFKLYLHTNGNCFVTRVDGDLYAFTGGIGGEPDAYYQPTIYTIANPYLKFNAMLRIDEDGVLVRNDSLQLGLLPIIRPWVTELTESLLTLDIAVTNMRSSFAITANDDIGYESAKSYLNDLRKGEPGVMMTNPMLQGISVQPGATLSSRAYLTQITETIQYITARMYQSIGLQSGHNMKREYIGSDETQLNEDSLMPFIDDMLTTQRTAFDKLKEMYGVDVTVSLSSAWERKILTANIPSREDGVISSEVGETTSLNDSVQPENESEDFETAPESDTEVDEEISDTDSGQTETQVFDDVESVEVTITSEGLTVEVEGGEEDAETDTAD